jgi:predicted metal-dependent TIM-barrel fold hydrolase
MLKYFDPHIHMVSRTTDDYQNMAAAGITGVIEPAFWQGQARTSVGSFIDYFDTLLGWERFRASMFGIHHFCTIGLNPVKDGVVAVGEIGYDDITPEEDRFLAAQLELARQFNLPVLVHTPHRDKIGGTKRTLAVIREVGIAEHLVIIDHLNELTLPLVLDSDCWRGHSIYPNTKMSEQRMVALLQQYGTEKMVVNSAADWGISDPLKVPKTGEAMLAAGFSESQVEQVLFHNPVDFFAQSGQLDKSLVSTPLPIDQRRQWQENSALRGQEPVIK